MVTYERLKVKLSDQRVVLDTYKRWLFTQGSYYRALSGKILLFWIGGRLLEVGTHGGSNVLLFIFPRF